MSPSALPFVSFSSCCHLYCHRVHLGLTQTIPLGGGAFMVATMWPSWHFVCDRPPQPWSTGAIFSGLKPATKTLGRKKMWKRKHDWWPSLILFSATPGWMTADRSRLRNNCSPPDRRHMLLPVLRKTNLQLPLSANQMFSQRLHKRPV